MADDTPSPEPASSYSDPIYDRLEVVMRGLGRRWWLIALIAIGAAIATVAAKRVDEHTPLAASADQVRFALQQQDRDALAALIDDESIHAELRAQAGIEAAALALSDGEADTAADLLDRVASLVQGAQRRDLRLLLQLSQAAVAEARGTLDEALADYRSVSESAGPNLPALGLEGTLGAGRVLGAQAEHASEAGKTDEAMRLRRDALQVFELAAAREDAGLLAQLARYQAADLVRRFPALKTTDSAQPEPSDEPVTAPPPAPDDAQAE